MGIIGIAPVQLRLPPDGAVQQAGVEMRQTKMRGQRLGNGALARCRGAVDGDYHCAFSRASMRVIQSR